MFYLIYKITNQVNGKIYIGKHITNNKEDSYMGSGSILKMAQKKYGIENFKKEIIFECSSEEEMNMKERELVSESFISRKDTYNLMLGGSGGWSYCNNELHTNGNQQIYNGKTDQEILDINTKRRISRKKYFDNLSEEQRKESVSHLHKYFGQRSFEGKHHTEEAKRKIGEANKVHQSGCKNSNYGNMWIKNPNTKESKLISKNDPIPNGWIKGRFIKK